MVLARLLRPLLLALVVLAGSASAQPLDISTVWPDYAATNPRVQPGQYGGRLRVPLTAFQPLSSMNILATDNDFLGSLYPPLMEREPNTLTRYCNLCVSYEVSDDSTQVTFRMREGLTWSDGEPLTAHDVAFSAQVFADPDLLTNYRQIVQVGDGFVRFEAVDDLTLLMRLPSPLSEAAWQERARLPALPRHVFGPAYDSGGVEAAKALYPMGTTDVVSAGTWRFGSYSPEEGILLEENRDHNWAVDAFGNPLPYLDELLLFAPEEGDEARALAEGRGDFTLRLSDKLSFERVQSAGKVVREVESIYKTGDVIIPNFTHPDPEVGELLRNGDFRIALSMLVNREGYVADMYGDLARPTETWNVLPGYRDLPYPRHGYDPEGAAELLESLALSRDPARTACPNGCWVLPSGNPLVLRLSHFMSPNLNPTAAWLADALQQAGLEVVDEPTATDDYIERVYTRDSPRFRDIDLLFASVTMAVKQQEFTKQVFDLGSDFRFWGIGPVPGQAPADVQPWEVRLSEIAAIIESNADPAVKVAAAAEGTVLFAEHLPMIPLAELRSFVAYDSRLGNTLDQVTDTYQYAVFLDMAPILYIR